MTFTIEIGEGGQYNASGGDTTVSYTHNSVLTTLTAKGGSVGYAHHNHIGTEVDLIKLYCGGSGGLTGGNATRRRWWWWSKWC